MLNTKIDWIIQFVDIPIIFIDKLEKLISLIKFQDVGEFRMKELLTLNSSENDKVRAGYKA